MKKAIVPLVMGMLALAAAAVFTMPAWAQDAPAEPAKGAFTGCFGGASVSGQNTQVDETTTHAIKQFGIEAGCDHALGAVGGLVLGESLKFDTGSGERSVAAKVRAGIVVNPGLMPYAFGQYTADATTKLNTADGILSGGVGLEFEIKKNLNAFVEVQKDLARYGASKALDEQYRGTVGVRSRF